MTGYNDLVKGHIDPSKENKKKKIEKKNAPPPTDAETQKENVPEQAIPWPTLEPVTDASTSPRPTETVLLASQAHEENPSQHQVSEEGEIP